MDLKEYREDVLEVGPERLSKRTGLSRQSIYNLEGGDVSTFEWSTVRKLRNGLKLPRSVIIDLLLASIKGTKNDLKTQSLRQRGWNPDAS